MEGGFDVGRKASAVFGCQPCRCGAGCLLDGVVHVVLP
jgi:hypothetical protein